MEFRSMSSSCGVCLFIVVAMMSGQIVCIQQTNSANQAINTTMCLERASKLDACLLKLVLYGDRSFEPPRDEKHLDEHCLSLDENHKCVSSYSRECLPPFARNIYSVLLRRLKSQFARRCKTSEGRKDFLTMMACADRNHMEPAHKCMDSFIAHLEHVGVGDQSRQIELTCCAFQVFQDCIFGVSKRIKCSQRLVSSEKSIEYVRTIINSMGGDVMDFMCGRYDKLTNCFNGYPEIMNKFGKISERINNGTMRPQATSPIKPMLALFIRDHDDS